MAFLKPPLYRKEGNNITIEEIRDWEKHEVTKDFMERVTKLRDDNNKLVHLHLSNNKHEEAMNYNAAMDAAEFVLELPDDMVSDIEEEEKS